VVDLVVLAAKAVTLIPSGWAVAQVQTSKSQPITQGWGKIKQQIVLLLLPVIS